ncbi:MAG: glycosyltransferase family 2 protein [Calothrix sp. MO_167.B12]|nr:glycosyltransferase family 2 protein [Calothrix sp. MO_167.B12]
MSKYQPKVSIGLPVYNGENFIRAALDSILAQTFTDFELIISDNASTDNTEAICREYMAKDCRIKYYKNDKNLGGGPNYHRTFELSNGEYFKWAAHDDVIAPDFLSKCIDVLDQNPDVVLCHSLVSYINENGDFLRNYNVHLRTNSPKIQVRFHDLLAKHLCYPIFGLIRTSALQVTPPQGGYGAADAIFLLRLALQGRFYEIPEYLFFSRSHAQQSLSILFPDHMSFAHDNPDYSVNMLPDLYGYAQWFDSSNDDSKLLFQHWRVFWEYLRSAWLVKMSFYERLCCHISIIRQFQGTEILLFKDFVIAAKILWNKYTNTQTIETTNSQT